MPNFWKNELSIYQAVQEGKQLAILLGYSGHAFVVAESALLNRITLFGYADQEASVFNPYQLPYLGDETKSGFEYWHSCKHFIIGVGSNSIRAKIADRVKAQGGTCLTIIHPDASVAKLVEIGDGTFIARNVSVNPLVNIGENVILNTSCSIDHECSIADNVHIAPGAVLAGNVIVGKGAFIGANAVIREGVNIGKEAVIGAGSVVVKDVPPKVTVAGNPSKRIK